VEDQLGLEAAVGDQEAAVQLGKGVSVLHIETSQSGGAHRRVNALQTIWSVL